MLKYLGQQIIKAAKKRGLPLQLPFSMFICSLLISPVITYSLELYSAANESVSRKLSCMMSLPLHEALQIS